MATLVLHQPAFGKAVGDKIAGKKEDLEWYVLNGIGSLEGDNSDKTLATSTLAKHDPTLAANREKPGEQPTTAAPTTVTEQAGATQNTAPTSLQRPVEQ